MPNNRLPKQILYSQLKGQRAPGGPKKRFKDNIKTSLKKFNIMSGDWENLAVNRDYWTKNLLFLNRLQQLLIRLQSKGQCWRFFS